MAGTVTSTLADYKNMLLIHLAQVNPCPVVFSEHGIGTPDFSSEAAKAFGFEHDQTRYVRLALESLKENDCVQVERNAMADNSEMIAVYLA